MKKYKFNKEKVERNILVIMNLISIGLVIHKIATCGISFFSTIGYFG